MNQWGDLFDSFVDAAFDTHDDVISREEILGCLNSGTLIPGRYMYSSDLGAANWIRLCNDAMYRHHRETVDFWANSGGKKMADLVHKTLERDDLDFISLGPGDGQKDAELVSHWLESNVDVFYYPYDISRLLAAKSVHAVRERTPSGDTQRLRIKAVLADFHHLRAMGEVFKHRASPNVVALLGSLGNLNNELRFLKQLKQQMLPDDLLILEVRLTSRSDQLMELKDGDAALRFDFGALESYLGLKFDPSAMTIKREPHISSIADTETTIVGCKDLGYRDQVFPEVKLIYVHQYQQVPFVTALESIGFDVLEAIPRGRSERFLVCLVQRAR
jgi:hypothetical protein